MCLLLYSGCTKIKTADPIYEGNWIGSGTNTPNVLFSNPSWYFYLSCDPSGYASYYSVSTLQNGQRDKKNSDDGNMRIDWSHKHLYIGITKFKIIQRAYVYTAIPDTFYDANGNPVVTDTKMILENSFLQHNVTITFFKYRPL